MIMYRGTEGQSPSGEAVVSAIETKPIVPRSDASTIGNTTAETAKTELPFVAAPKLAESTAATNDTAAPANVPPPAERANRATLLAAAVAIVAAVGAVAAVLDATGLTQPATEVAESTPVVVAEAATLENVVMQLRAELAALKAGVEAGSRNTDGQFARIANRFDRLDQADPTARLERLEKRVDAIAGRDTTGSITPPAVAGALPVQRPVVDGWVVRDVYRGSALIQGRRSGMIEVAPGDTIPGIGRVEAIRQQNGRWVVITARGLIVPPR